MKKSILILLSFLFLAFSFAEVVSLDRIVYNNIPVQGIQVQVFNTPTSTMKSVPVLQNELYGTMTLNGRSFNLVLGKLGKVYEFYVDTDADGFFESFNRVVLNKIDNSKEVFESLPVVLNLKNDSNSYPYIVRFTIDPSSSIINYECAFWKMGEIKIDNEVHTVSLFNYGSNGRFDLLKYDIVGVDVSKNLNDGRVYLLKDTDKMQIGKYLYSIKSVNLQGDKLTIQRLGLAENKFSVDAGSVLKDLSFTLLSDSSTVQSSLKKASQPYTIIFTWQFSKDENFLKSMETLKEKFSKNVNFVGICIDYLKTDSSDDYEDMNIRFYLEQNKLTFNQMTYKSGMKTAQELNLNSPNEIILIGKDNTVIYKTVSQWTMNGDVYNCTIDFEKLSALLKSIL